MAAFTSGSRNPAQTGALLTMASMFSAQLGLAGSVHFLGELGGAGAVWLRLTFTAILILALIRPWRLRYTRAAVQSSLVLGIATAGMTIMFMNAALRLPLGTAAAIEFLGALSVSAYGARKHGGWMWTGAALVGVLLLTQPWQGKLDTVGVAFALGGALCYAGYIIFTQKVGDEVDGVKGLAISMPVAALVSIFFITPATLSHLTWEIVGAGLGLAILVPFLPFILEMVALKRITAGAFATLVCLEPAFGLIVGLVLLGQVPDALGVMGMACVVIAGMGAVRSGARVSAAEPGAAQIRSGESLAGAASAEAIALEGVESASSEATLMATEEAPARQNVLKTAPKSEVPVELTATTEVFPKDALLSKSLSRKVPAGVA